MKRFKVKVDAEFDAENIDDALKKLGEYFARLAVDPGGTEFLFDSGVVDISPLYDKSPLMESFLAGKIWPDDNREI